jgi:hypothetical protein
MSVILFRKVLQLLEMLSVDEMLPSVEDSKIDLLNMLAKDQVNIGNNHLIFRK